MSQDVLKNEVAALEEKLQENSDERLGELTDDCRLLVISHMPLAYAMAWRMKDYGVSVKDLRQEGCLGLCEAALRYDESVGCRFATYASYWCRKKIFLAIRHQNPSEDLQEETLRLPEDEDDSFRTEQRKCIDEALQCLTQQEQQIIRLFYGLEGNELSITEISTALGLSKARITALHQRSLLRLKAKLGRRPFADNHIA